MALSEKIGNLHSSIISQRFPGGMVYDWKYVCHDKDAVDHTMNKDFLDDYFAMAPLCGEAYTIDSLQVNTFLVIFVSGNDTAEV